MNNESDTRRRKRSGLGDEFYSDNVASKIARLDAIARMDDPMVRDNNRYVLRYMSGTSDDYDDGAFLLTFCSMMMMNGAAWQKGKLDGQVDAIRSGYVRDPRTGVLWRLHPATVEGG